MPSIQRAVLAALALALAGVAASATASPATCQAASGATVPTLVELYTSEGCSSCPPADRWVSTLAGRSDVIALAYHVDYWDGPGWRDRFAQAAFTRRQAASQRTSGARFSYTPQVVVDGRDTPERPFPSLRSPVERTAPQVTLTLARGAKALELSVSTSAMAPARLDGFVAVVDDGLSSRVAGGENRGATLHHDAVVRELLSWSATRSSQAFEFTSTTVPESGAHRHWVAVALDDAGRPVQAVSLRCE